MGPGDELAIQPPVGDEPVVLADGGQQGAVPSAPTTPRTYSDEEFRKAQSSYDTQIAQLKAEAERERAQAKQMLEWQAAQLAETNRALEEIRSAQEMAKVSQLDPDVQPYAKEAATARQQLTTYQIQLQQLQNAVPMALQLAYAYRTAAQHGVPLDEIDTLVQQNAGNPAGLQTALQELSRRREQDNLTKQIAELKQQVTNLSQGRPITAPNAPVFDPGITGGSQSSDGDFMRRFGAGELNSPADFVKAAELLARLS